ncbi:MAG: hypothetical protein J1F05_04045 [Muribaculaceae bacterium]|nr:hypothetical protein [Muribaculaceae bacterium]
MVVKNILRSVVVAALVVSTIPTVAAAAAEEPIISFHTSIYDTYGSTNTFTIVVGGISEGYIDVDCGYGPVEYELEKSTFDAVNGAVSGTYITCAVSGAGDVKIYGDASLIDYVNASGCYIRNIDISRLSNLAILNLEHNELEGLDLTPFSKLQFAYLADNPYTEKTPLVIGKNKPELVLLQIGMTDYIDPTFNLSDYPAMTSFDAYAAGSLTTIDPTGCPELVQLSIDVTPVSTLDVTKNPKLQILNISDTKITDIDLSHNPLLSQLYADHSGSTYGEYKLKSLDVSKNPELFYLFAGYNDLTSIDLSKNPKLFDLSLPYNKLTELDLSKNTNLYNVNIRRNNLSFATMPENPGTWGNFLYDQREIAMARSYKVGEELDFSNTMLREGTETVATLYYRDDSGLDEPQPVSASAYSFESGKLTFKSLMPDSVYVVFDNSMFAEYPIYSSNFVVKSEADFGKDIKTLVFSPAVNTGAPLVFTIGVAGATLDAPKTFTVDFGDGVLEEYEATGSSLATGCEVKGIRKGDGYVEVYVPEGVDLSAFAIENVGLNYLDLSSAPVLRELSLTGTKLNTIDLSTLRCLQQLYLTGNNFNVFSLVGKNGLYIKNELTDLQVPNNGISYFEHDGLYALKNIDISKNNLEDFNFETALQAETINISKNKLIEVDLTSCESLRSIDLTSNKISDLTLPEESVLENLYIGGNAMTLANLPAPSTIVGEYIYAPQAKVGIPVKAPGADLSSQYLVIDGATTQYAWFKSDGTEISEGTDYTIEGGKTRFLNTDLGKVYCELTHSAYPQFSAAGGGALKTTELEVAAMPQNVIASFTTPVGGESVMVSLASTLPNTTIYFDWKGDGIELEAYDLDTTYRLFTATTTKGSNVKVYSYDDAAPLSIFSISGASMSDIDVSKLTSLSTLTLRYAGLNAITLPATPALEELILDGNKLTSIDLSKYPKLRSLSLPNNKFSGTFDLSPLKNLEVVSLAANNLSEVIIENPLLGHIDLSQNNLTGVNLEGAPAVYQAFFSGNQLSAIDIRGLNSLRVLFIDANCFTFATLPMPTKSLMLYEYSNQARLDVVAEGLTIDLSSQARVGDTATQFTWFIDEPSQDEEGNWIGEDLYEDDEYVIEEGVVTFSRPYIHLVGLMQNEVFPNLDLFTNITDLSGVENVSSNDDVKVSVKNGNIIISSDGTKGAAQIYTIAGSLVRAVPTIYGDTIVGNLTSGVYIVTLGGKTAKVALR